MIILSVSQGLPKSGRQYDHSFKSLGLCIELASETNSAQVSLIIFCMLLMCISFRDANAITQITNNALENSLKCHDAECWTKKPRSTCLCYDHRTICHHHAIDDTVSVVVVVVDPTAYTVLVYTAITVVVDAYWVEVTVTYHIISFIIFETKKREHKGEGKTGQGGNRRKHTVPVAVTVCVIVGGVWAYTVEVVLGGRVT